MKCFKCGNIMTMLREVEQYDKSRKNIKVYYKCFICNNKIFTEEISMAQHDGSLFLTIKQPALLHSK